MDIVDEEEPRVGDIKVGAAGDTQRLPDSLPMEDSYLEKEFFVRDCYPVYYDLIINALYKQGMWCVRSLELQHRGQTGGSETISQPALELQRLQTFDEIFVGAGTD
ncbi:hypothetical protein PR001_g21660 [Phytophthora rubi]|uniref:Uncharacterized protein n=1 Tax=Phytophthora rubi TaxID=129364 RepID=A0A6A3JCE7_9STRA|nr:hypothetical protein PR001_g21660 [Phytophthora rubi]